MGMIQQIVGIVGEFNRRLVAVGENAIGKVKVKTGCKEWVQYARNVRELIGGRKRACKAWNCAAKRGASQCEQYNL